MFIYLVPQTTGDVQPIGMLNVSAIETLDGSNKPTALFAPNRPYMDVEKLFLPVEKWYEMWDETERLIVSLGWVPPAAPALNTLPVRALQLPCPAPYKSVNMPWIIQFPGQIPSVAPTGNWIIASEVELTWMGPPVIQSTQLMQR